MFTKSYGIIDVTALTVVFSGYRNIYDLYVIHFMGFFLCIFHILTWQYIIFQRKVLQWANTNQSSCFLTKVFDFKLFLLRKKIVK